MDSPKHKATLGQFIDDHSKLITSIAAFVALTAFALQLGDKDFRLELSSLAFLGALLLAFELLMKLPPSPRHWRLEAFAFVLGCLVMIMGAYWFSQFPEWWVPLLAYAVELVAFFVFSGFVALGVTKTAEHIAQSFWHRGIQGKTTQRIGQVTFLTCLALLVTGMIGLAHKLGDRQIRITVPGFKTTITTPAKSQIDDCSLCE